MTVLPPSGRPSANAGNPAGDFVIVLDCPDQPGIVHAVSGFLVEHGGNIIESQQFGDRLNGRFFMRIDFAVELGEVDRRVAARGRSARSPSGSRWSTSCGRPRRRTAR